MGVKEVAQQSEGREDWLVVRLPAELSVPASEAAGSFWTQSSLWPPESPSPHRVPQKLHPLSHLPFSRLLEDPIPETFTQHCLGTGRITTASSPITALGINATGQAVISAGTLSLMDSPCWLSRRLFSLWHF